MTGPLERGRAAFAERWWGVACTELAAVDAATPLDLDDLELFALAAYLSGQDEVCTRVWTRAHRGALVRGDRRRAARHAVLIGAGLMFRGEGAPAMGWFARCARVLEGCGECAEGAWLRTWQAFAQMWGGDPAGAESVFADSVGAGEGFGDLDLVTMSRLGEGMCRVLRGQGPAGVVVLDEVMAGVIAGEVSPMYAGMVYCTVIAACADLFDLRRAREWTAALTRWCDAQPELVPFRGNCLVHRCELMQLQGAWRDAQEAAEQACDLLSGPVSWDTLGSAYYQLGELQRLRGEFTAAEESYRKADEAGRPPEPGLALLRLAQGRLDVASTVIRRVAAESEDPPLRSRVLPAYVEIMIAAGDLPSARAAADELTRLAAAFDAAYLDAVAASAVGAVLLAEGDPGAALRKLRRAASVWRELDAPRETARVRVLLGLACRALDDTETSTMELRGARTVFERLGATPDIERLDALTRQPHEPAPDGLTGREVEVLRLIATGRTNRAIASTLGLSEKTVARHVSNCFSKIGVASRAAATAYAYEHALV
ncbi:LuxR family transcriptional regulator [Lentzea waywayandensis]|nr:LuxR family transcriptional regulator [Lentzea waywayandensis]